MIPFAFGTQLRLTVTFADTFGVVADPSGVSARVLSDQGAETDFVFGVDSNLTKLSVGVYQLLWLPPSTGAWYVRWQGTGAVIAASLDQLIFVEKTRFP